MATVSVQKKAAGSTEDNPSNGLRRSIAHPPINMPMKVKVATRAAFPPDKMTSKVVAGNRSHQLQKGIISEFKVAGSCVRKTITVKRMPTRRHIVVIILRRIFMYSSFAERQGSADPTPCGGYAGPPCWDQI